MTLTGHAKCKGKVTRGLKNEKKFGYFQCEQSKDSFCRKYKKFQMKKYRRVMTLKSDAKFEEKLTLGSKTDMMNLVNFNGSSGKSENLHFDVLRLSKVCV